MSTYKNFEKAVRFADQQSKTTLFQYEEKVKESVDSVKYNNLTKEIEKTTTAPDWRMLAEKFKEISYFKNSKELISKCTQKAELLEKKLSLEEIVKKHEESKKELTEKNGVNCNWYIFGKTWNLIWDKGNPNVFL